MAAGSLPTSAAGRRSSANGQRLGGAAEGGSGEFMVEFRRKRRQTNQESRDSGGVLSDGS
ncbi:unnamed protein product [Spirodela intermedia]|uniref:Uncharacterized protein n=1 Tax=Spirodela intermedia TaxID=51605 RepID=A0ABN7ECU4_SPIIN|nr:unnamed protein product [Spirodela intermedia]